MSGLNIKEFRACLDQIFLELKISYWILEIFGIFPHKIQRNSLKLNDHTYIKLFVVAKYRDGPLFFKS